MTVIAFDTETHLIEPGLLAPPMVCVTWQEASGPRGTYRLGDAQIAHANDPATYPMFKSWLLGDALLVGHNVAYDLAVVAAKWPDLVPLIFAKYDRDEITDTLIREQLIMISRGQFRSHMDDSGELHGVKYSLDDCIARHFGRRLDKDTWRLRYAEFTDVPVAEWPEGARHYALEDARSTLALYQDQERVVPPAIFVDQFRQARAAFALHLSSCWGIYTDPDAVDALEVRLQAEFDELTRELQAEGLIRENGTANVAAARDAMVAACHEEGFPVARTAGGAVSLSSEACDRFDADTVIGKYSQFLTVRKTLANDIKMLRGGCETPLQPRYGLADTGRTTAARPQIQAINRDPKSGIREAFRPRPGMVFAQADFEGLELHTLAQWCLEKIGWSKLAESLNAGKDAHLDMAAEMMGITYEEALVRKKAGDKNIKEYRQRAKPVNFGYPGGLGIKRFRGYAWTQYKVALDEAQAAQCKNAWLRKFPEMIEFFRLASAATTNGDAAETHIYSGRVRGGLWYAALCNGRFQGLGADAAKEALWRVTRAQYAEPASPLFGTRTVAFVHDEIIIEAPLETAAVAAAELGRVMIAGANTYLKDVPVRLTPQLMTVWSKNAEPVYDAAGVLVPWSPPVEDVAPEGASVAA